MKTTVILFSTFFYLIVPGHLLAKRQFATLETALKKNWVKACVHAKGGHSGYCANMHLKNTTPDSLEILIEPGRRLNSVNEQEQDLLIVKAERVRLKKWEEKLVDLKSYCCQLSNRSPQKESAYNFKSDWDTNLVKVASFLNAHSFESSEEQAAVWAISEGRSAASVTGKNDSSTLLLRKHIAQIRGEVLPWYTVQSHIRVQPSGEIISRAVYLRGTLVCNADATQYAYIQLTDSTGQPVAQIIGNWYYPGRNEQPLNMPLFGLVHGQYRLQVVSDKGLLYSEQVEI